VTRRPRVRLGGDGTHATHNQVVAAQRNIKAAIELLDWLTARDLTLPWPRAGKTTWRNGWPARKPPTALTRGTSSAGPAGTS